MKFKRNLIKVFTVISVLSIQTLFSSCNNELEVVQSINEEFVGIDQVEIKSGFLDVKYQGDPNLTTVQLNALLESTNSGRYLIEYREESGKLIIELDQKKNSSNSNDRGYIYLTGPVEMGMDLEISSGEGLVSNVESGEILISVESGSLDIQNIKANEINLRASSGEINVLNLASNATVEISSGSVTMKDVIGDLKLSGSSGKYELTNIKGLVNAQLSSGNMDLLNVESLGKLEVSSGRINAQNSGLSPVSKFNSTSGSIMVQTLSNLSMFNYDLTTSSGSVTVGDSSSSGVLKIDNGSPYTVSGTVSSGSIKIRN
jgi:hypothetical protein